MSAEINEGEASRKDEMRRIEFLNLCVLHYQDYLIGKRRRGYIAGTFFFMGLLYMAAALVLPQIPVDIRAFALTLALIGVISVIMHLLGDRADYCKRLARLETLAAKINVGLGNEHGDNAAFVRQIEGEMQQDREFAELFVKDMKKSDLEVLKGHALIGAGSVIFRALAALAAPAGIYLAVAYVLIKVA